MANGTRVDRQAVNTLAQHFGAHLIRVKSDKRPAESKDWQHRQLPLDDLLEHVDRGGRVAITPESISKVVLDIDYGDALRFASTFPPAAWVPSRRPGRTHLYYSSSKTYSQTGWSAPMFGVSGQVRSRRGGYVVLWQPPALVEDLERGRVPGVGDPVPFAEPLKALDLGRAADGPESGGERRNTGPGTESCRAALLDGLVKASVAGESVRAAAARLWAEMDHPGHLGPAELERLVSWVQAHRWDSDAQRQRGILSGVARRAPNIDRDAAIADMLESGGSLRSTAAAFDLSVGAVRQVKARLVTVS